MLQVVNGISAKQDNFQPDIIHYWPDNKKPENLP
jgi:hypothetical protein